MRKTPLLFVSTLFLALSLSSCSSQKSSPSQPAVFSDHAPAPESLQIPPGQSSIVTTTMGAQIRVTNTAAAVPSVSGVLPPNSDSSPKKSHLVFDVEGTFAPESFANLRAGFANLSNTERNQLVLKEIQAIFKKMEAVGASSLEAIPEVGYFTFQLPYSSALTAPLKTLGFVHELYFNPIHFDSDSIRAVRSWTTADLELALKSGSGDPRNEHNGFSGLERMGAPEFVALAESAIGGGAKVDGSSVRLGISDTGITFNHPTFTDKDGKPRIVYMKDFTGEGRVYFSPHATFSAVAGKDESTLKVNAQIISTPKLPSTPAGDVFTDVKDLEIKVSPALKAILLDPKSGAKLGILDESVFQSDSESTDINANGKTNDKFYLIFVPGQIQADGSAAPDVVYFDAEASADFSKAIPLEDWNITHKTVSVFAEKMGFNIRKDKLLASDEKTKLDVASASIVGFDPGNHGSHVAGIAAGRKTIANDPDDTLARGVAPAANILMNRVCSNAAGCNATLAVIDLSVSGKAEVINMSLGGLSPYNDGYGVEETVINRLTTDNNTLFVISAGNSGPGRQTVGSPSVARQSMSIGASASRGLIQRQYEWPGFAASASGDPNEDFMLFFSSRGPTAAGGFKPNISAPGTELSSIQLNSAPGAHGGLDVYWGTSMAAPSATGAFALFLDAVKKYNLTHTEQPLATDVATLRAVFIESARPFDMSSLDVATGAQKIGQYTFIDEGAGMINLPAAWNKLLSVRANQPVEAVRLGQKDVPLDYMPVVSMTMPNGLAYDGSVGFDDLNDQKNPKFGTGITINYFGTETLRTAHIARRLPESAASGADAGELTRQLLTTADDFVLKTVIYGSNVQWLKAGVLDSPNCWESESKSLSVLSRGVDIQKNADGSAKLTGYGASQLNVCLNRTLIKNQLAPGDHGALILGYRTAQGKTAVIPSFILPVYLTVPHRTLADSTAYEIRGEVKSFGVDRNYVTIPAGTNIVKVTLEADAPKVTASGQLAEGESCSGIELMMLEGGNTLKGPESRAALRVGNCDTKGVPITGEAGRVVSLTRSKPKAGVWDIHVFGRYQFTSSKYKLRVDYLVASSPTSAIDGDLSVLNGSLDWKIKESSVPVNLDATKSTIQLSSLYNKVKSKVENGKYVMIANPLGTMRHYPAGTSRVTITTGGAPGNDIDLIVLECDAKAVDEKDPSCEPVASSGGPTDVESASFEPSPDHAYMARADGFAIKQGDGTFESSESIFMAAEKGTVTVSGAAPEFKIGYSFTPDQIAKSAFLQNPLFIKGDYQVAGNLNLKTTASALVESIPVLIHH